MALFDVYSPIAVSPVVPPEQPRPPIETCFDFPGGTYDIIAAGGGLEGSGGVPPFLNYQNGQTSLIWPFEIVASHLTDGTGADYFAAPMPGRLLDRVPPAPPFPGDPRSRSIPSSIIHGIWLSLPKDGSGNRQYDGTWPFNLGGEGGPSSDDASGYYRMGSTFAPGGFGSTVKSYYRVFSNYMLTDTGIQLQVPSPQWSGHLGDEPELYPILLGSNVPGDVIDYNLIECDIPVVMPNCAWTSFDYTPGQTNQFAFLEKYPPYPSVSSFPTYNNNIDNTLVGGTNLTIYPIVADYGNNSSTDPLTNVVGQMLGPGGIPCSFHPDVVHAALLTGIWPYEATTATISLINPTTNPPPKALGLNGFQKSHVTVAARNPSAAKTALDTNWSFYALYAAAIAPYLNGPDMLRALPCTLYAMVIPDVYYPAAYYLVNDAFEPFGGSTGDGWHNTICVQVAADVHNAIGTSINTLPKTGADVIWTPESGISYNVSDLLGAGYPPGSVCYGRRQEVINIGGVQTAISDTGWVAIGSPTYTVVSTTANAGFAYELPFVLGITGKVPAGKGRNVETISHPHIGWFGKAVAATDGSTLTWQRTNGPYTSSASLLAPVTIATAGADESYSCPSLDLYFGSPGDQIVLLYQKTESDGTNNVWRTMSADEGATWSTPVMAFANGTQPVIGRAMHGSTGERIEAAFIPDVSEDGTGTISATIQNLGDSAPSAPLNLQYWNGSANVDLSVQDSGFYITQGQENQGRWFLVCTAAGDSATSDYYSSDAENMGAATPSPMTFTKIV